MGTINGVKVGLSSLYYATLTSDASGGVVYGTPTIITGIITANINPNSVMETLFADDGPLEVATQLGNIEFELNVADIPLNIQAILLGHSIAAGIMERVASDTPPWVAIGFKALKSNGNYRYVWLYKGKFRQPELNHDTKDDSVNFQTLTIVGHFVKRDYDDKWLKQADEDESGYQAATGTNWFNNTTIDAP
jgi:phi13 family phage major tail protein